MQAPHFDTVVIGSGVAGLSFLHYYAGAKFQRTNNKSVALFCKSSFYEKCCTNLPSLSTINNPLLLVPKAINSLLIALAV